MRSRNRTGAGGAGATADSPPLPHVIHPTAVYSLRSAQRALEVERGTLPREIRLRRLRVSKRGKKYYFLGEWLLEWLRGGEITRARSRPPEDQTTDRALIPLGSPDPTAGTRAPTQRAVEVQD